MMKSQDENVWYKTGLILLGNCDYPFPFFSNFLESWIAVYFAIFRVDFCNFLRFQPRSKNLK